MSDERLGALGRSPLPRRGARRSLRDLIGRAIYGLGLWLCGVAGWWDAGTDR